MADIENAATATVEVEEAPVKAASPTLKRKSEADSPAKKVLKKEGEPEIVEEKTTEAVSKVVQTDGSAGEDVNGKLESEEKPQNEGAVEDKPETVETEAKAGEEAITKAAEDKTDSAADPASKTEEQTDAAPAEATA